MDTTLAINPGSSSKKYAFFRGDREIFSIRFEHTTEGYGKCVSVDGTQHRCETIPGVMYDRGLYEVLEMALKARVITSAADVTVVGIRVVAPHPFLATHRTIDSKYMKVVESLKISAPLHIPYLIEEIHAAQHALPHATLVGVSDSAFHTNMPSHASLYSFPDEDREKYHIYRYGYHGLSVASVVEEVGTLHGKVPERMIVMHVGSGVSMTAVKEGKSIDTTMGFGPASGLLMGTRGGDIDAVALLHIMRAKEMSPEEVEAYLNSETGLKGLSGSSDLRIVLDRAERGEYKAQRALDAFFYHIHKTLHAYIGILRGVDAIVLTATAAERNAMVRTRLVDTLSHLGVAIDESLNEKLYERAGKISTDSSPVAVYVIPTKEMSEVAKNAHSLTLR